MKPALGYAWGEPLTSWQQIPTGDAVRTLENELICSKLKFSFGHHLIRVGALSSELNCSDSLIEHQINVLSHPNDISKAGIIAEYDELPLQNNSVDLALLNHVLEFSVDPHQVLREAHRVLLPSGTLILTLFNPWSLLILAKLWPFKSKPVFEKSRLFSIARVKDWLHLLGFELTDVQYACYSSLVSEKANWQKQGRFNRFMHWLLPKGGSVCVITAKKREWPLTPIRPRLRIRTSFSPAIRSASVNSVANKHSQLGTK
ncbi:MAG: class I SAM-dependent methyltransferase [Gammaproteobacteria bacterium]|nr:class I SAM-dependent methyltransferase [Gammaproteobacteria bacterium]